MNHTRFSTLGIDLDCIADRRLNYVVRASLVLAVLDSEIVEPSHL